MDEKDVITLFVDAYLETQRVELNSKKRRLKLSSAISYGVGERKNIIDKKGRQVIKRAHGIRIITPSSYESQHPQLKAKTEIGMKPSPFKREETCPCQIRPTDAIIYIGPYWSQFRPEIAYFDTPETKIIHVPCLKHNRQIVVLRKREINVPSS